MAAGRDGDVYATLLLNDVYLPGALVLAHSLRDAGTTKKLAVLVTTDSVSSEAMAQLHVVFDFVIPVERIVNQQPTNLSLMDRIDLHSAFTKIRLWEQLQFRKIVYMDADMVALRAPDELFNLPESFSAAPDIGWPDLFNTGLLVLTPNMGDFYALLAMAQRGISFDGADQGLLNMHFKNSYNRLSFSYNVTPSGHYQYVPAYRHFQSTISAAHFIGKDKPWTKGRFANVGNNPYDEMVGRWWAVYDRHYRPYTGGVSIQDVPQIVQYYVNGEWKPPGYESSSGEIAHQEPPSIPQVEEPMHQMIEAERLMKEEAPAPPLPPPPPPFEQQSAQIQPEHHEPPPQQPHVHFAQEQPQQFHALPMAWDASRAPPPAGSKPEAQNFPSTHYEMSSDPTPFKAPQTYPEPPRDMYYEVPKTPTYQKPTPIFPWEKDQAKPTRVFAEDLERPTSSESGTTETTVGEEEAEPTTPTTPTISVTPADSWQSFSSRGNAWDEIPEINRYVGNLQKSRRSNIQAVRGFGLGLEQIASPGGRRSGTKLTDFPTEVERPSLPVTPAPIRRPSFWGGERDEEGELPAADGVPAQEDWDPVKQLEFLARRQSEILANKLGSGETSGHEIPSRSLPYGSEGVISPTYVPQQPPSHGTTFATRSDPKASSPQKKPSEGAPEEPSFRGPSAQWEKDETFPISETPLGPSEEEKDVLDT